jgi:hypothetical protein
MEHATIEVQKFETWAIVEIMGHHQYAGWVTEAQIGGATFLQVDIPQTSKFPMHTKYVGAGSVFALHPCTEEIAQQAAERLAQKYNYSPLPVSVPAIEEARRLTAGPPAPWDEL